MAPSMTIARGLALGCLLLVFVASARAAGFTPLGDLPGGPFDSVANAVSDDGQVVAGTGRNETQNVQAFRWTPGSGLQGLPGLPNVLLANEGLGLSRDGRYVVGTTFNEVFGSGFFQPARWDASGQLEVLSGFGRAAGGVAWAASGDGSVVVGTAAGTGFRWTDATGPVSIGDLPGGVTGSTALAVSADGSVLGGQGSPSDYWEPTGWTGAAGIFGLGSLGGGPYGVAKGVSPDGSVMVGTAPSANGPEAFRWTEAAGMIGLGDLPGGSFLSIARGVSANGQVIVGQGDRAGLGIEYSDAFVWTETGGMQLLFDALVAQGATGLDGWALRSATAVSADGQWIVGWGINPTGGTEAFRAQLGVVPVPAAAWLFASALALMGAVRRRRRAPVPSVRRC